MDLRLDEEVVGNAEVSSLVGKEGERDSIENVSRHSHRTLVVVDVDPHAEARRELECGW